MSRREQIGLALAALCLASAGIVAGTSAKNFTWTGTPMRVAYAFGFLACVCVIGAFARRAWFRVAWGWVGPYLPRVTAPERRLRLRRRHDVDHAQALFDAGRTGERLAAASGTEIEVEIEPRQVAFTPKPRRDSALARAAASLNDGPLVRSLIEQGSALHTELWEHANRAKVKGMGLFGGTLPKVYLGQADDWCGRVKTLAKRHMSEQEIYRNTEPFPARAHIGIAADPVIDDLDKMFTKNVAALRQIERRL